MLVGVLYFLIGIISVVLAGTAASDQMLFFWRWSAFAISAVVFIAHILHQHFRLNRTPRQTAWHAAVAAAIGGFGLAVMANIHELGSAASYRPRMLIALVAWPLLTGVPAFLAALVIATGLRFSRRRA